MKPYIGILIDSFWEAVGNRVLWVLLIGWALVLAGLAPFGYISRSSYSLSSSDIDNRSQLVKKLAKASRGQGGTEAVAVASRLDEKFVTRVREMADEESKRPRISSSDMAKELNVVLKSADLYSEEDFPTAKRRKRLEPLIEQAPEDLNEKDLEELNRELLQLAFPLELNRPRGEQLWFGYAGIKIGTEPLPFSRRQANKIVEPILQQFIVRFGLGFVVVFVALIVTSSLIPDTFRSSSLHLLLSKPISRVWLFLSKFFGSCFFVLLNFSLVILGVYLIAGFRLGIWNEGLFWCIPILMFVFVIFYSVSAFVGLMWGNAIVCVITCILFWLGCFMVGVVHQQTKVFAEVFPQIKRIVPAKEHLLAVNGMGELITWNSEYSVWQPAIAPERFGQARTFGPVYSEEFDQAVVWSFSQGPFNSRSSSRKVQIFSLADAAPTDEPSSPDTADDSDAVDSSGDDESEHDTAEGDANSTGEGDSASAESSEKESAGSDPASEGTDNQDAADDSDDEDDEDEQESDEDSGGEPENVDEARQSARWTFDTGPSIPAQVFAIEKVGGRIITIHRGGLYYLDLKKLDLIGQSEKALFGIKLPFATSTAFEKVSPADFFLSDNTRVVPVAGQEAVVAFSSGSLDWLDVENGKFKVSASVKLEGDSTASAVVAANSQYVVVAREELPLTILDSNLEILHAEVELPGKWKANQLAVIPETNRVAIVTSNGQFLQLDCQSGELTDIDLPFGRNCTSMHWLDSERVWLGVMPNRAALVNVTSGQIEQNYSPTLTGFERFYRWGIHPVYTVLPKPSSLRETMQYVLSGEETVAVDAGADAAQLELDIWEPIYSNLIFVAVMLGICCGYIARKEF